MMPSILKSLMKPAAYPVPTRTVELLQTHVSWLFLTETHVFKIKKPVNFGFLDFSTVDRRRFYCNEELRLNRRLCPDVYEAVVELRESDAGVAFHGAGPVIDYAVMMKRLPADNMLDRMLENGEVTMEDMKNVAAVISRFHSEALTSQYISSFGSLEKILYNWRENFEQLIPFKATTLPAVDHEAIQSWVMTFAETNLNLFSRRVEQGYIRECDGDIHLENICLVDGRVYIFDCIEFSDRFRFCDTAADIAFLLMDLDFHNRSDLSDVVIGSYLEASGDPELTKLIDFYKIYRAVVRGKVESFLLNDSGIITEAHDMAKRRAIRYFRLARGYIERLRLPPTLFITCGTMGCGKSTLAKQLAFELGMKAFSSDFIRKKISGVPPETAVHEEYGQGLYEESVSERTYGELERLAECELAAGNSVIVDASFRNAMERSIFVRLAARSNAAFIILMVSCDHDEQRKRLSGRIAGAPSVSDGRMELLELQKADFDYPSEIEGNIIPVTSNSASWRLTSMIYQELNRL
ncbi:MAG: AAA family ATPase [Desulfuromonadaceae bacterium]|nr:AAA family ATPase [Desulfuromonadaceae bacterium]